jgi:DNA gyrase subunit B
MLFEVVDNAINEALTGHCGRIEIMLNAGGSATVRDDGRGIPTEIHPRENVSAAEYVITHLGSTDGFPPSTPKVPDAFPTGIGLAVVNALSELFELHVWRNGKEYFIRCRAGEPDAPIAVVGTPDAPKWRRGTEITFVPSSMIFMKTEFDFAAIERRLRGFAYLNVDATIALSDRRSVERREVLLGLRR